MMRQDENALLEKYLRAWPPLVDREVTDGAERLVMEIEGDEFPIALLRNAAPKTCDAFVRKLPLKGEFIHAAWSGDVIRMLDSFELPEIKDFENGTYYLAPGDVCYTLGHKEFTIIYGDCDPRMPYGAVREVVFGIICERLKDFQKVGRLIRVAGARKFTIKKEK
jgi:hypothetical protein